VTDAELVAKKLALIETYVEELRTLSRPEEISRDLRERRFAEHTLQIAIQAALDVASHIVSDDRLGEPRTNRALFELLEQHRWIDAGLSSTLRRMVGLRNLVVHGYAAVDPRIVQEAVEHRLGDLLAFVAAIRARLGQERPGRGG
jgi:uncharacterized protein YutE (UPF0331/DUF86 family)